MLKVKLVFILKAWIRFLFEYNTIKVFLFSLFNIIYWLKYIIKTNLVKKKITNF